ncbi:MAG: DUF2142 domain-containing protein [Bacteroidales bacterium]|jgi:uncharacterized membrane protein|nr:DUF2142 domain-containing protein [Bacteroidales bacterium]
MKKHTLLLISIFIFLGSILLISVSRSLLSVFPSQEVELSNGVLWGRILKENLLVQEIKLKKRYLNRIDVCFAKMPSATPNKNIFLLLNEEHKILFTKKFSSDEIDGAVWMSFDFKKSLDLRKNKKVFACIYSIDGNPNSCSVYARTNKSNLGKSYVTAIQNNDVIFSLENQQSVTPIEGSMGFKIYESNTKIFTLAQIMLYIFILGICLIIVFAKKIKTIIQNVHLAPEYIFLPVSLFFGLLFAFITPPFQVPDEPSHLYRAYQVSELNLFKYQDSIPKSLVQLSAISDRMKFNMAEKTSRKEIMALSDIKLSPGDRTYSESPNYIIPYLPQAMGIFIGRFFGATPISFFYLGRIFNLLVSVFLLFLAIKITPVFKWVFFLLGIMPMTIYLMASLSYDASTICLSFLFIAIVFKYAFNEVQNISPHEIILLFLIAILLASSKPPYFIAIFSFLIIPVQKFGSWKKYLLVFAGLTVTVLLISQLWAPSKEFFKSFTSLKVSSSVSQASMIPLFSFAEQAQPVANQPSLQNKPEESRPANQGKLKAQPLQENQQNQTEQTKTEQKTLPQAPASPYNPPAQKKYILDNPIRFIEILIDTVNKFIGLYFIAFVGLFGWVDTPLPIPLVYLFLFLLIIISLSDAVPGITINFLKKCILLTIFLTSFVFVETAMYVFCNPVGYKLIQAVQGRYFIALSPLLFIILYNNTVKKFLNRALTPSSDTSLKDKRNKKRKSVVQTTNDGQLYAKSLPWLVIGFGIFALIYSLYTILFRFYIVLI